MEFTLLQMCWTKIIYVVHANLKKITAAGYSQLKSVLKRWTLFATEVRLYSINLILNLWNKLIRIKHKVYCFLYIWVNFLKKKGCLVMCIVSTGNRMNVFFLLNKLLTIIFFAPCWWPRWNFVIGNSKKKSAVLLMILVGFFYTVIHWYCVMDSNLSLERPWQLEYSSRD